MNRIQKITVRLNDVENKVIRENANKNHINVSEYIRNLVKQESSNGGTTTPPSESIINNQAYKIWSNGNNT